MIISSIKLNLYYTELLTAPSRNVRGELVPPPPPAYVDIFPDHPNLIEEVNHLDDSSSEPATASSVQSNEVVSSLQTAYSELHQPVYESTTPENPGIQISWEYKIIVRFFMKILRMK